MEITLKRTALYPHQTSGMLSVNGVYECLTLEDTDRHLTQTMSLDAIKHTKVFGQTAIPTGRYQVVVSFSDHFQQYLPLLLNVPGFDGIRIHKGNFSSETEGCLLVGQALSQGTSGVEIKGGASKPAFDALFKKIQAAVRKEKIWITIGN